MEMGCDGGGDGGGGRGRILTPAGVSVRMGMEVSWVKAMCVCSGRSHALYCIVAVPTVLSHQELLYVQYSCKYSVSTNPFNQRTSEHAAVF